MFNAVAQTVEGQCARNAAKRTNLVGLVLRMAISLVKRSFAEGVRKLNQPQNSTEMPDIETAYRRTAKNVRIR
jgi:hypothetical protein